MKRYTGFLEFEDDPGSYEEIDVDAHNLDEARQMIEYLAAKEYEPGLKLVRIEERRGLYV